MAVSVLGALLALTLACAGEPETIEVEVTRELEVTRAPKGHNIQELKDDVVNTTPMAFILSTRRA